MSDALPVPSGYRVDAFGELVERPKPSQRPLVEYDGLTAQHVNYPDGVLRMVNLIKQGRVDVSRIIRMINMYAMRGEKSSSSAIIEALEENDITLNGRQYHFVRDVRARLGL